MKLRILTDTSSGMQPEMAKKLNIELTHMPIMFGEEEFIDGVTLSPSEFYDRLENGKYMPKTALINTQNFVDIFEDVKNKNDEMIVFPISKHLSATHINALQAKKEVGYDKIYIVDTLQTTTPLTALVLEAIRMRVEGKSAEEIFKVCDELKTKIKIGAIVRTLKYLHAGGRLSTASATIGTMLNLKPIVSIVDGKVVNIHKCVGLKSSFAFIKKTFLSENTDRTKPVYFCHTNNLLECQQLKNTFMEEKLIDGGTFDVGATVASHVGSGVVGMVYFVK